MACDDRPVIVHLVHSLEGGGTERTLVALLHALDSDRFRHQVVTLREAGSLSRKLPDRIACRPLAVHKRNRGAGLKLALLTRRWRVSAIHARNIGCWFDAIVAGRLTPGMKLVLGFHGLDRGRVLGSAQKRKARLGLASGAVFTTVSEVGRQQLCQEAMVPAGRTTVIRNGVDLSRYAFEDAGARQRARSEWGLADGSFVVGAVGSLTHVKRYDRLISAVAMAAKTVPELQLVLVGDGPLRQALKCQAQTEGIAERVRFLGWREDVAAMLGGLDAYVCSSESEGMSNALLEAMATGLPIVATDVGEHPALLRDDVEGFIVESQSITGLADRLATFARSPDRCRAFAAAARRRAEACSFQETVNAYEEFYRTLLSAGTQRYLAPRKSPWPRRQTAAQEEAITGRNP